MQSNWTKPSPPSIKRWQPTATYRKLGDPAKSGAILSFLGSVHERQGQHTAALSKYQEALALMQQYGSPQDTAIAQNLIKQVRGKL